MLASGGAAIDRAALRLMEGLFLAGGSPNAPHRDAQQSRTVDVYTQPSLLADPERFYATPSAPEVEVLRRRGPRTRVRWRSGYQAWDPTYQAQLDAYETNRFAHAELLRHRTPGAATVVCVHSWVTDVYALQRVLFGARALYAAGYDVALPMLPFHGPRTPKGVLVGGQLFPGISPQRTNEGFGQAAWDVRALIAHLRATGSGPVGVMGMSLGGCVSALLASLDADLAFSVPMIPLVSFGDLLWHHGRGRPERKRAEARGVTLELLRDLYAVHTPLRLTPRIPAERRMIVAGTGDRVCSPSEVRRLWEHWERPRIHWFPGSHLVHFGRGRCFREVRAFIDDAVRP